MEFFHMPKKTIYNHLFEKGLKGFRNCEKICAAHDSGVCCFSVVSYMEIAGICGHTGVRVDNNFFDFHVVTVCIIKRNTISEGIYFVMCLTIFSERHCTV